jgi:hypothetical protein
MRVKNINPARQKHQRSRNPRDCEPHQTERATNQHDARQKKMWRRLSHHENYPPTVNE